MEQDITASDIKRLMIKSYRRFTKGEISENRAFKENALLGNILKSIEASETEKRLQAIERTLNLSNNYTNDYEQEEFK